MLRNAFAGALGLILAAPLPAVALGTFTGKVRCVSTYNGGDVPPFASTDVVTLEFVQAGTDGNRSYGTVTLSHTETNTAGIYLNDVDPMNWEAFVDPESGAGLVAIRDPGSVGGTLSSAIGAFKQKNGGPIGALRFSSIYSSGGESAQRCAGTLKAERNL